MLKLKLHKNNLVSRVYENFLADPKQHVYLIQQRKYHFKENAFDIISYNNLFELISKYIQILQKKDLVGKRVVILHPLNVEMLALLFAMFATGTVPVFIDPNVGFKHLKACIASSKADFVLTNRKLKILAWLLTYKESTLSVITLSRLNKQLYGVSGETIFESDHHEIAGIFYTSGSTGVPKGVIWTHENMRSQIELLKEMTPKLTKGFLLALFPLFLIYAPIMGNPVIWPKTNLSKPIKIDPKQIIKILEFFPVELTFGSPIIWKRMVAYCQEMKLTMPTIKAALCGGAPLPQAVIDEMKMYMKEGDFLITYGATEALPISFYSANLANNNFQLKGTLLGKPFKQTSVKIIPETDIQHHIPKTAYNLGEIAVKGSQVTPGYIHNYENASKNSQDEGWHYTGDYGYLDEEKNLWYFGRKSHAITIDSKRYYPVPIEKKLQEILNISICTIAAVSNKIYLIIEKKILKALAAKPLELLKKINKSFEQEDLVFSGILEYPDAFPVDKRHYSKLNRSKIQQWASTQK
ncbi:AMP-binding protein [Flavobacteriaceae bacterium M23B6Z8]